MAMPQVIVPVDLSVSAAARLLADDVREQILAVIHEILERNACERLAYSPEEAAELLGHFQGASP